MPRVKRGVTARARHKKVINAAKGYRGRRGNVFRVAKQAVNESMEDDAYLWLAQRARTRRTLAVGQRHGRHQHQHRHRCWRLRLSRHDGKYGHKWFIFDSDLMDHLSKTGGRNNLRLKESWTEWNVLVHRVVIFLAGPLRKPGNPPGHPIHVDVSRTDHRRRSRSHRLRPR